MFRAGSTRRRRLPAGGIVQFSITHSRGRLIVANYSSLFSIRRLWVILGASMLVMFGTLLYVGAQIYQAVPPIPIAGRRVAASFERPCYSPPERQRLSPRSAPLFRSIELRGVRAMAKIAEIKAKPFLTDVKTLRARARKNIGAGNITATYECDPKKTIDILQTVLATEIVCVLRYTMHAVAAAGISSESVKKEFQAHADEEREHMQSVAERINQLGGTPDFDPKGLETRAASEYGTAETLVEMIKENLIAERLAVDHYRELIRYFGDDDPTTRRMLEWILTVEEEHTNDMHDLLVAHQGKPMLSK